MSNKGGFADVMRQMVRSGLWGWLSLCAVNLSAVFTGISVGFGWLSVGVSTVLGVPGVISVLFLNALFLSM